MKNTILKTVALTFIIASCGSGNNVVNNRSIQKRKYTKGWFLNSNKQFEISKLNDAKDGREFRVHKNFETYNLQEQQIIENSIEEFSYNEDEEGYNNDYVSEDYVPQNTINDNRNIFYEQEKCDEIIERDGEIISAKVIEIGVDEIKYKKCENADGPTYYISKDDVFMIKYANGSKDIFEEKSEILNTSLKNDTSQFSNSDPITEPFSIIGIILSLAALIVTLLISIGIGGFMSLLALIFGALGLSRIKSSGGKFKGRAMANTALTLGIVGVAATIAILILLLL
jgi:flagellar biosynthesis GTPase FlhF